MDKILLTYTVVLLFHIVVILGIVGSWLNKSRSLVCIGICNLVIFWCMVSLFLSDVFRFW